MAISISAREAVSGVRSSCDAFATNRRWASRACSSGRSTRPATTQPSIPAIRAMIASAIPDSSSSWFRSAIRCFSPPNLTAACPDGVLRRRSSPGESLDDGATRTFRVSGRVATVEAGRLARAPTNENGTGAWVSMECETSP